MGFRSSVRGGVVVRYLLHSGVRDGMLYKVFDEIRRSTRSLHITEFTLPENKW